MKQLRSSIGLLLTRLKYFRSKDYISQFTKVFTKAQRVLVILPEEQPDKSSLRSFLQQFNYYAAKKFISIIMRKELGDDLIKGINALFIQYSDDDINNFYLPKKSLCKKLKTNTYDLVVDLNLKFSLTSAVLCKESNAPVRVCLSKERGNEFFNFLLNPKDPTNNNATYSFLMNCLLMF